MISLENQVAIVTGAGRGIGRAIALELSSLGMRVALAARTRTELEETARSCDGASVIPTDVRDPEAVRHLVERTVGQLGPVDVLVNAAGVYHYGPLVETGDAEFDRVLETNLRGIFSACRSVLPHMVSRNRGHIVNIASIAGKVGSAGRAVYCASKFGVVGFTQALAEEVREDGVRVSVICPGSTDTGFSPKETAGKSRERMLRGEDVAHAVRMLLGQAPNSFISEVVMRPARKP
jgi:3-oxoacyl-[acyl-carrier protein] reductase